MKTFTVTFHHSTNYGASLQTYALQHTIEQLGHENMVMEYPYSTRYYSKISFSNPKVAARQLYINVMLFLRKKQHKRLIDSFAVFHRNHLKLSPTYHSIEQLRDNPPQADCLITGSDQVWNLNSKSSFAPAYFLDFGNKESIRFSYAASIEGLNYSDSQKEWVKERIASYKGISLREESAKQYLESFTDYKCERVLDPVFLLSKETWNSIAIKPRISEPYILCYQVLSNPRMQEVVDKLKKTTGYKIVTINNGPYTHIKADYSLFDVSPEEFLGFYNDAKIVVTTSFHGSAFGIVYGKPTYSLIKNTLSNRIKDLFNLLGLQEFVISSDSQIPEPIMDERHKDLLKNEVSKSLDYLKRMLMD